MQLELIFKLNINQTMKCVVFHAMYVSVRHGPNKIKNRKRIVCI